MSENHNQNTAGALGAAAASNGQQNASAATGASTNPQQQMISQSQNGNPVVANITANLNAAVAEFKPNFKIPSASQEFKPSTAPQQNPPMNMNQGGFRPNNQMPMPPQQNMMNPGPQMGGQNRPYNPMMQQNQPQQPWQGHGGQNMYHQNRQHQNYNNNNMGGGGYNQRNPNQPPQAPQYVKKQWQNNNQGPPQGGFNQMPMGGAPQQMMPMPGGGQQPYQQNQGRPQGFQPQTMPMMPGGGPPGQQPMPKQQNQGPPPSQMAANLAAAAQMTVQNSQPFMPTAQPSRPVDMPPATSAPAFIPGNQFVPSQQFTLNRPTNMPQFNATNGQAKNKQLDSISMNVNITEFKPSQPFKPPPQQPTMNLNTTSFNPSASFVPSNQPRSFQPQGQVPMTMSLQSGVFQPGRNAPMPAPVQAPPPKPVEPPKEKSVLLIERIVKGKDENVKNDEITEEDTPKVKELTKCLNEIKKTESNKKITVDMVASFVAALKTNVANLPANLVKMSVHSRVIQRDDGEDKGLMDKQGGPKRNTDGGFRGRGGRGNNRGNYRDNDRRYNDAGRGRGGGGHHGDGGGFQTRQPGEGGMHGQSDWDRKPVNDEERRQVNELRDKMDKAAHKMMEDASKVKTSVQKIRLKLNQITPDNLERKISELREMLIGDHKLLNEEGYDPVAAQNFAINEDVLQIVVQTIFRKAQVEHTYSKFYSQLCSTIVKIDLESQGKRAIPSNLKHCNFRKKLLEYCRSVFEEIFQQRDFEVLKTDAEAAGKKYTMDDFKEMSLKRQHKLFGNIEFIGELFLSHLLRADTAKSIFENLLNLQCFADDTVEAAIKFIEKIGPTIEERIRAKSGGESGAGKRVITQEEYKEILDKFKQIWETSEANVEGSRKVAKRIQKLIQNMIENQALGWKKLKLKDKDVKTKQQVESDVIKQLQAAEQTRQQQNQGGRDDGYGGGQGGRGGGGRRNDNRDGGGNNRRDDRRDGEKVYMKKQSSVISNTSDGGGRSNKNRRNTQGKGQAGNESGNFSKQSERANRESQKESAQQQPQAPKITLTEDQLKTKIQQQFNKYVENITPSEDEKQDEFTFQDVKDLISGASLEKEGESNKKVRADDVFAALIAKMIDMDQTLLEQHFEGFMQAWLQSQSVQRESWKFVVKRSIIELENYLADLPHLTRWISSGLINPLLKGNTVQLSDLDWYKEEEKDELFDVSGQFKVAAYILSDMKTAGSKTPDQIRSAWQSAHGAKFEFLNTVFDESDKSDFMDEFMQDSFFDDNRDFVISTLGLGE